MNPPRDHWKHSVVCQVYPRSFCDSNGDGIGDIPGITSRLDHLQALGIDVVWLSPICASPNDDNGYDISDYRAVMPEFGTMADFDAMLAAMHARGMKLVMDLVVNHSSDKHRWFQEARQSRDNPFHDHYIWREPKADGSLPTHLEAAFNGSVWEWNEATGEYYLHIFSKKQPDLNWDNPDVRADVYAIMRFWVEKGVDGFRMDVINMISKPWKSDGSLPDATVVREGFLQPSFAMTCNGPSLLELLREMRAEVLDHYTTLTVREAPLATVKQGVDLTHPQTGAHSMLFQFEHMDLDSVGGHVLGKSATKPLSLPDLKRTMQRWQDALDGQGWNSLYLSNHDQPRPVSRFGDDSAAYRKTSAKLLGTWLHGLQGTPYIYQGEVLGMPNVAFPSVEQYQDIEIRNHWRTAVGERGKDPGTGLKSIHAKGRDNARTPMPWNPSQPNAGFSSGTPWLPLNPNWSEVNAAQAVANLDSVFHHYRRLIALPQQHPVMAEGRTTLLMADHANVSAVLRRHGGVNWLIVCNFSAQEQVEPLPPDVAHQQGHVLLGNLPHRRGSADERSSNTGHEIALAALALAPWESLIVQLLDQP